MRRFLLIQLFRYTIKPFSIKAMLLVFNSSVSRFSCVRYSVTNMVGAKLTMFCSPQPYGILINESRPLIDGPILSPANIETLRLQLTMGALSSLRASHQNSTLTFFHVKQVPFCDFALFREIH